MKPFRYLIAALLLLAGQQAGAVLSIQVTDYVEGAVPIAVVPFGWEGSGGAPLDIAGVVAADLQRSGRFAPMPEKDMVSKPHNGDEVNFQDWRLLKADDLVVGRIRSGGPGVYNVQFQLLDVYQGKQLTGYNFTVQGSDLRRVAHRIADIIYEALTGQKGAFSTRIAFVTAKRLGEGRTNYTLEVADADGEGNQTVLESPEPLMSPSWSPDGTRVCYVSFEHGRAEIYIQEVASGRRELASNSPGINGAPAWSPDGRKLALTLSRDGNPDIYILDLASKALTKVTDNNSIDTEPAWSPEGDSLLFTSDRGGGPQIYKVSAQGGSPKRITYEGRYNASAGYSPDGRYIALVHGTDGGAFRIAVLDLKNNDLRVLTDGRLDESPSFAPNGSMIIYATESGGRGVLAAVSVDGRVKQKLVLTNGDVREPAWSPFRNP